MRDLGATVRHSDPPESSAPEAESGVSRNPLTILNIFVIPVLMQMVDPISRYCSDNRITATEFARKISRSPQLLADFKAGRCGLSDQTKLDVVAATGGRITLEDLTIWSTSRRGAAA